MPLRHSKSFSFLIVKLYHFSDVLYEKRIEPEIIYDKRNEMIDMIALS